MLNPVCHTHTHTGRQPSAGPPGAGTARLIFSRHFQALPPVRPAQEGGEGVRSQGARGGGLQTSKAPSMGPSTPTLQAASPPDYAHQPAVLLRSCVSQRPHCSPPQVTSSPYSPREPPEDKDVKLRHTLRDLASESTRPATSNSSEGGAEGWREGGREGTSKKAQELTPR